ncbi:MAG: thioredoxin [Candidatus Marinimicrobia bacterium]|jgi:thioredoxin 1|nr:thioredoxin [Candidatus Neomarinimicrobiota bacterium]MBT3633233.1 thioredoxin [Candidatus Neomarinimicrobiota bacterium]MBT3682166.1 thioredoxin [Candidatus Neomarinimicrobiota bacterium]MBT3758833.1 thioredoxin [Candidatus Neomarinimicrobiota bacterium]MBT3895292.1 thioredoxin [Candidatus Neomarinimicrobiota bacterium]
MFNLFKTKEKSTISINDANWDEIINSNSGPVMVDIWAPWCGPCKLIGPIVEELAEEYKGKIIIGKLNADENTKSRQMGIRSIPTLLFFKDGKKVDQITCAQPMNIIREKFNKLI